MLIYEGGNTVGNSKVEDREYMWIYIIIIEIFDS